ncbi:hypothetical protein AMECASPLE_000339 [Ameca splendens]|uniref:Uncharacterized protein n=1 Tax=Ameca splendens TaxID=208324 RepID=A0ABV0XAQ3_9TELE
MLISTLPVVLMHEFTFSAGVQREALAAVGTLIDEDQGRCNVSHSGHITVKRRPNLDPIWVELFVFTSPVFLVCHSFLVKSLQPAMEMWWSRISLAGVAMGFS